MMVLNTWPIVTLLSFRVLVFDVIEEEPAKVEKERNQSEFLFNQTKKHEMLFTSSMHTIEDIGRIIEMAWEDRTPFEAIEIQFGLTESEVVALMRRELKASSFRRWRRRVTGRRTKHLKTRGFEVGRHRCSRQKSISRYRVT